MPIAGATARGECLRRDRHAAGIGRKMGLARQVHAPAPCAAGRHRPPPLAGGASSAGTVTAMAPLVQGARVLVVDDEPLVAMDVSDALARAGCQVLGPAGTLAAAATLIASGDFDAALLDANLSGKPVDALAAALAEREIPFAFLTGYARDDLPEGFRDRPVIGKPFTKEQLLGALDHLLSPQPRSRR